MAGERRGLAYERIVHSSLARLLKDGHLAGSVFPHLTPSGMSITTDFAIGVSESDIQHIVQITHSGSKKDSSRKFWRNVGELVEAKLLLEPSPTVVGIYFDSLLKDDIVSIQSSVFDGLLVVPTLPCFEHIGSLCDRVASRAGRIEDVDIDDIASSEELAALAMLSRSILQTIQMATRKSASGSSLTANLKASIAARDAQQTGLVRGLAKLLLFPNPRDALAIIRRNGTLPAGNRPPVESQLLRPSLRGQVCVDAAVQWVAHNVDQETAQAVLTDRRIQVLNKYLTVLRTLDEVDQQLEWLSQNWGKCATPSFLLQSMRQSHESPSLNGVPCRYSWVYYTLIESLKQVSGLRQGYGLSKVLGAIESQRRSSGYRQKIRALIGSEPTFRAVRSIERLISVQLFDRNSPHSSTLFSRYCTDMAEVAVALADAASQHPAPIYTVENCKQFKAGLYQLQFECNVAAPKGFDYLRAFLDAVLARHAGDTIKLTPVTLQGALAEKAISEGATIRADSGVCEVLQCRSIVIDTQSATDQGRDHKKKELVARAVSIKLTWDTKTQTFIKRGGISRLVLLVDGAWTESDLNALQRAGWDDLFYPHETEKLLAVLQSPEAQQ